MIKIELRPGKKGKKDLVMVVCFEKDTNFNPETLTWVPRKDELQYLVNAGEAIIDRII